MRLRLATGPNEYKRMTTQELRKSFLIDDSLNNNAIILTYCEVERAIAGFAMPTDEPLLLEANQAEMAADYFCQRREVGIINIGGKGKIVVDDKKYEMEHLDGLYIGKGSKEISFCSEDEANASKFYILSYPAHTSYSTTHISYSQSNKRRLGSVELCNKRTINQYIHNGGVKSCQLVMGFTEIEVGSVWNTMPSHTHQRRSEIYMYFNIKPDAAVFHLMGPHDETRLIVVKNGDIVISPMWSMHSGVGTNNYSFVWGMGGENQTFDDMDNISINDLK